MPRLPTDCPSCEAALDVTRLGCPRCGMQLEGKFELPPLLRLPKDDLDFVTAFVKASGSLKEMGALLGQSYPTVRNRLDEIIRRLSAGEVGREERRRAILDAVAAGKLSVKEAAVRLEELES